MRTFKVITSSVGGTNNKIYQGGDEVTEDNFPPGNADQLVAQGFLFETKNADQVAAEEKKNKQEELEAAKSQEEKLANEKADSEAKAKGNKKK